MFFSRRSIPGLHEHVFLLHRETFAPHGDPLLEGRRASFFYFVSVASLLLLLLPSGLDGLLLAGSAVRVRKWDRFSALRVCYRLYDINLFFLFLLLN